MIKLKCVIFDFGGVISLHQTRDYLEKLLELTGKPEAAFAREYRKFRDEYDRGRLSARKYWSLILGQEERSVDDALLSRLIECDVKSWTTINTETRAYMQALSERGIRVAVLSNINFETVEHLRQRQPWFAALEYKTLSCELNYLKPEREIYEACIKNVGFAPSDCLFIDDMERNVAAAAEFGMHALRFENPQKMKTEIEMNYGF